MNSPVYIDATNDCITQGLHEGQSLTITVNGCCMEPLLRDGDAVVVRKQTTYRAGDIVAYFCQHEQKRLIHRVLGSVPLSLGGRKQRRYIIKADSALKPDPIVDVNAIFGAAQNLPVTQFKRLMSFVACYYWLIKIAYKKIVGMNVGN